MTKPVLVEQLPVRMTTADRRQIGAAAKLSGQTESGFIRHAAIERARQLLAARILVTCGEQTP